jgi:predicted MFS family arabinose efflux permease
MNGQRSGAIASAQRRSPLVVIVLSNLLLSFGFQLWRSLFNNFAVQELGVRADQMGLVQSIREIPGLLGFTVGLLALLLTEIRIAGLSIVLMGLGIVLTGASSSMPTLVASTLVMSVGFHFFVPSNSSVVLQLVRKDEAPHTLGWLSGLGALASLVGSIAVFLLLDDLGFRALFYATGALLAVGGVVLWPWMRRLAQTTEFLSREEDQARPTTRRAPIRRRYWLYYVLQFLMGSRRHIFTTFAVFLLVQEHGVTAQTITVLFLINNLIGAFVYRQFGKVIAHFGERRVLTFNFLFLIFVFLGYAYVSSPSTLYLLFVVDQVLFGFSIALQSYFQKIAVRPQEITPNLSLGQTINHVAAVVVPVVGGVVWETVGSRYTFLFGVGIVILLLILVQGMDTERKSVLA